MRAVKDLCLIVFEGVRYYFCLCPRGWWKSFPPLPIPSHKYIRWRLDTAYGQTDHGWERPPMKKIVSDAIKFLLWRRKFRLATKKSSMGPL